MRSLISFNNLQLNINDKAILHNISGSISTSQKIGLVGNNGAGKTTLLKLISKMDEPTSGQVIADISIAYVKQFEIEKINLEQTVTEYIQAFEDWWKILDTFESTFKTKLNPETKVKDLSGGELTKINIADAISRNPEVILLDEPTNHLDLNSVKYLIDFINKSDTAFLIASHDIDFLNNVVNEVWEIEGGKLRVFGGNYDDYILQKDLENESKQRNFEVAKKELTKLDKAKQIDTIRSQKGKAKLNKMKESGGTPKIVLNGYKNRAEGLHAQNQNRIGILQTKAHEKLEQNKSKVFKKAYIDLQTTEKRGKLVKINNENLIIKDKTLIENISFDLNYGERVSISGNNGSGKSLLIKNLIIPASTGKTLYLSQKYENVDYSKTVFENMESIGIGYESIRKILGNFLFLTDEDLKKKAKDLSGGELARLSMAILTSSQVDLLILDEPTNNLDISTIEILVEALTEFKGGLIVVSHNRKFLREIRIEKEFKIEGKNLV